MRKTLAEAIEGLERRVIEGFEHVDHRLDGIDGRLNGHDGRFERIDQRFLDVARRFDAIEMQIAGASTNVDELRAEMYGQFDAAYQRFDRLETEYQMLVAGIRRIEAQMAEDRNDRSQLHAQVSDLRERVKELEERLKELLARLDDAEQEPPPSKPS